MQCMSLFIIIYNHEGINRQLHDIIYKYIIGKRDQILRALFNEKVATSVSHQNLLLFERKVFEVNVSRVCSILHV